MKALAAKLAGWGPGGLLLLAFLDGTGVPLPGGVDAFLIVLCAGNPSQAYFYALLALVASVCGSMILFFLARKGGEVWLTKYTSEGKFKEWFLRYGLITVFIPAFFVIPMPLKAFVICAGAMGVKTRSFFLTQLIARTLRYLGLAYLAANYGEDAWPWLKAHGWHMGGLAAGFFLVVFLWIRFITSRRPAIASV